MNPKDALADWSPEQLEQGRAWVRAWRTAGVNLDRIRRDELRALDVYKAIELVFNRPSGDAAAVRSSSGLVEQQRWFMKAAELRGHP